MTRPDRPNFAEAYAPPGPLPAEPPADLPPDGVGYRVKRRLLGQPLQTDQPTTGTSTRSGTMLEAVIEDDTGAMSIVFSGRKQVSGLEVGTRLRAQGMSAEHRGRLAIFNPTYALLP